jgi:ABC-type uncharacterized transport system substrate-binding protein
MTRALIILLMLICLWPCVASAHPHIYADYTLEIVNNTAGISALKFHFTFDDMYTTIITSELHVAGAPQLDNKNMTVKKDNAIDFLAGQHFYLFLTADGRALSQQEIHITSADKTADGGYDFNVNLPAAARQIVFSVYDPTYYISVMPVADTPLKTPAGTHCDTQTKDIAPTIWGMLQAWEVSCGVS